MCPCDIFISDICTARKAYESLCSQPNTSLDFHKKMTAFELMQPEISLKHARRTYEMAMLQYGNNDTSVWMDYIMFELKHGDPKQIGDIHARAVKCLKHSLTHSFIADYSLLATKFDSISG